VCSFHTNGIERWRSHIIIALDKVIKPDGIYERSDLPVRKIDSSRAVAEQCENTSCEHTKDGKYNFYKPKA
jgi:hypothetical protein